MNENKTPCIEIETTCPCCGGEKPSDGQCLGGLCAACEGEILQQEMRAMLCE